MLSKIDFSIDVQNVQNYWNLFEQKLLTVIDVIVPYTKFCNGEIAQRNVGNKMKTFQNARKNLLKKFKKKSLGCYKAKN
jgi:hypothetical protein